MRTAIVFAVTVLATSISPAQTSVRLGFEFQVNDFPNFLQWFPDVAMGPEGEFVVSWQSAGGSYGNDTSDDSVQANRFGGPDVIFATGMDDGTLIEWSSSAP